MNHIFIAAHGHMASGALSSLEMFLGKMPQVTVFDAYVDEKILEQQVENFLSACTEDDEAIMVTDLYGGSVNNVLTLYGNRKNTYLVAGFNLAFLLALCAERKENITEERLLELIEESRNALLLVSCDIQDVEEEDIFED